ncbi:unnamed protein product [Brachionus calyciflorus]|uniref:Homeobox domain-containing protein n=1 Tax=Brachionus calyciflorus TaxID=104777 RepID=A0A813SVG4_9BILA|nr:unnamed protein product [Brachionus calyciflorus]
MSIKKSFLIDDILSRPSSSKSNHENLEFYDYDETRNYSYDQGQKFYNRRSPRIQFTIEQLFILENRFNQSHYLNKNDVKFLSMILNLSDKRIKIWFQNRRAREKFMNK